MFRTPVIFLVLCLAVAGADISANELKPFQAEALERVLASSDPESRELMRAQMAPLLSMMDEAQVRQFMASYEATGEDLEGDGESGDDTPRVAGPGDLEHNQAQWEPVVRSSWTAQKSFDDHVDVQMAVACAGGPYAVFGSGWRYELYPLSPNWPRASNSADLDVQIIGGSYAPSDGRYDFDFSEVKTDFDRAAVDRAIEEACGAYRGIGERFLATARPKVVNDDLPGGMDLEGAANAEAAPVRARLEEALKTLAPAGNGALFTALLNGKRTAS